ncbi:ABC transporter permease subunit [Listeria ivanovii]|uniref:Permease n=3 Tax=Listeria ivanovii TaxID=1638 RepID=A0ABS1G2C1_LISIV|nr:ABC transporter permease subunit [Listeria ivanovii]AIS61127.1 permease [Listeria ivanovii subsp. londoniensis]AIS63944.1 permease [Listeria ivanovii subsp. londoniensis]MBC2255391.1 permease [Listeria ivanovii]MBK1961023.1 permease [Listeria ivanovii subsp. londoniensis]MBK1966266.1 permease [Listeria ivanovii subsp. londoniensis]
MFNRGLWYREWRNMRWMLIGVAVLFFLGITLGLVSDADRWQSQKDYYESSDFLKQQKEDPEFKTSDEEMNASLTVAYLAVPMYTTFVAEEYQEYMPFMFYFQMDLFFTLIKVSVFILGVLAIIFERYTRGDRITASLPYKRTHIVGVKLILGMITIVLSYMISMAIGWSYFLNHIPNEYIQLDTTKFWVDLAGGLSSFLLVFLIAVLIGLLIGSPIAAAAVAFGVTLLPNVINPMLDNIFNYIWPSAGEAGMATLLRFEDYLNVFALFSFESVAIGPVIFSILLNIFMVVFILVLYRKQHIERSGYLFAFPWVKWPFLIVFSLVFGVAIANLAVTNTDSLSFVSYICWGIGSVIAVFILMLYLLRKMRGLFQGSKIN